MSRPPHQRLSSLLSAEQWRYALLLFVFSFLSVLYQTAITQEFSASITWLRAGFQVIFGLVHIFYGLGMYLAWRLFQRGFSARALRVLLAATGLAVALSLLAALRMNPDGAQSAFFLPASVVLTGLVLTLFGMVYSGVLVYFHQARRQRIGLVVALGLAGLILAFLLRPLLVIHLGCNLILALVASISILLALGRPGALAALLLLPLSFALSSLDSRIEGLRDLSGRFQQHSYQDYLPVSEVPSFEPLLDAWSPYAKINLYDVPDTPRMAGVYNYYITWIFDGKADRRRQLLFSFIEPDDQVLCLAIGGGWPLLAIPVADRAQITGVELDPVVVDFFKEHPQHNDGLFNQVQVVLAEGRAALETLHGPYDAIVIDLPGSPATQKENPIEFENFLLTQEAVERAFELLDDDGVLMAYLLPHQIGPAYATFAASGHEVAILHGPSPSSESARYRYMNETYAVYASRSPGKLASMAQRILAESPSTGERITSVSSERIRAFSGFRVNTDDRPYAQILAHLQGKKTRDRSERSFSAVLEFARLALASTLFFSVVTVLLAGRGRQRPELVYFLAIGAGFVMFQLYLYARLRSFFGDPVSTTMMATLLLFAASSVGSLLSNRIHRWQPHVGLRLAAVALLLVATHFGLGALPFGISNPLLRFSLAGLVIAPFGLVAGMFFPLGLLRVERRSLGWALALDAAGTFAGFICFYFLAWHFGIAVNILPVLGAYLLAAALLRRQA